MQGAKQKVKDMASAAKHHAQIYEAQVEEKMEKTGARTEEEKEIARERRKVKEAEAKAELHTSKAHHAEEKLQAKQQPYHIPGVGHHNYPPGSAGYGYPGTGSVGVAPPHQPVIGTGTGHVGHVPGEGIGYPHPHETKHHLPGRRLP